MNKHVEILKKLVLYCKKKNVPKKAIVVIITILLFCMFLGEKIIENIKKIIKVIFSSRNKAVVYIALGLILGTFVLPHSHMKLDDEKAYGDVNIASSGDVNIVSSDAVNITDNYNADIKTHDSFNTSSNGEINDMNVQNIITERKEYSEEELLSMSFYIKVNRAMNCITIYTADKNGEYTVPIKAMICSTGGEGTPLGIYNTKQRYIFKRLLFDVYGQYATRIEGQILFHSVSYSNGYKDTLIAEEFNKLGTSASHGCIRLTTEDAKWIYDYCSIGTIVEIYDDSNDPGPLGKPEMLKVPNDTFWDPTDIDPANTWNGMMPVINVEDREIMLGEEIDLLERVTAIDTCGNDISDRIKVNGNIDSDVEGIYNIEYKVTDLIGRTAVKSVNVIVKGNQ